MCFDTPSFNNLDMNENLFGHTPKINHFLQKKNFYLNYYPKRNGGKLKEALSSFIGICTDQLYLGAGSSALFWELCWNFLSKGDIVIAPEYSFEFFSQTTHSVGATYLRIPLNQNWEPDITRIIQNIDKQTKMIVIANPGNPIGKILDLCKLTYLLDNIPERIVIVIDEAYCEYAQSYNDYKSLANYTDLYKNLIVLR